MKIFLALSCLQQRPMQQAFDQLSELSPDGIQLTPGNFPTKNFENYVKQSSLEIKTHQGFSFTSRVSKVWSDFGPHDHPKLLVDSDSVHPPVVARYQRLDYRKYNTTIEIMYPSKHHYDLQDTETISKAIDNGTPLAVDVSHLNIINNYYTNSCTDYFLDKLFNYSNLKEIHISSNQGRYDTHQPITKDSYLVRDAVKIANKRNIPIIVECYMHKLDNKQRRDQLDLIRSLK